MRRPILSLASLALICTPLVAVAADDDPSPPIDCADAKSTVEMNFCADKDYLAADKNLNAAFLAAVASVKTRGDEKPYDKQSFEAALRAAQRAWIAYRDTDCKDLVAQEWSGGSGTSAAILGCMTEKTIQRTKELNERFGAH